MYNGVIKYIYNTETWGYQKRDYEIDKYNWWEIHGHVRPNRNNAIAQRSHNPPNNIDYGNNISVRE